MARFGERFLTVRRVLEKRWSECVFFNVENWEWFACGGSGLPKMKPVKLALF